MKTNDLLILKEFFSTIILLGALLTIFFLIYKKFMNKQETKIDGSGGFIPFEKEMFIQSIQNQFEKSFEAISDCMIHEYHKLYFMINKIKSPSSDKMLFADNNREDIFLNQKCDNHHFADSVFDPDLYNEVLKLAHRGMSEVEIAKMLNLPVGEIDLVIRLNNNEVFWDRMEKTCN